MQRTEATYLTYNNHKLLWEVNRVRNTACAQHIITDRKKVCTIDGPLDINQLNFQVGIICKGNQFFISDYAEFCGQNRQVKVYNSDDYYQVENGERTLSQSQQERDERRRKIESTGETPSVINLVGYFGGAAKKGAKLAFPPEASTEKEEELPLKPPQRRRSPSLPEPEKKSAPRLERRAQTAERNIFTSLQNVPVRMKGKEKKEATNSHRRSLDSETAGEVDAKESRGFLNLHDLLETSSSQGETIAYGLSIASNKAKLKKDLQETGIATGGLLIYFKGQQNAIRSAHYIRGRIVLLDMMIYFFNVVYTDLVSEREISSDEYENLKAYLTKSLIQACANTLLDCELDHEQACTKDKKIDEIRLQRAASKLLEDKRVHTILGGFALENLPKFFAVHVKKYNFETYKMLYENLFTNVKEAGQNIRADKRRMHEFTLKVYNPDFQIGRDNCLYDFIPLDAVINQMIPNDTIATSPRGNQRVSLRQSLKNLLTDCFTKIHYEAKSPRSFNDVFKFHQIIQIEDVENKIQTIYIKEYHAESLVKVLIDALKMDKYKTEPKKCLTIATNLLKNLESKNAKKFLGKIKDWIIIVNGSIQTIDLDAPRETDNFTVDNSDETDPLESVWAKPYDSEDCSWGESVDSSNDTPEARKKHFFAKHSIHLFGNPARKESKFRAVSHRKLSTDGQFKRQNHPLRRRSRSCDSGMQHETDGKDHNGINLDINKLLERSSHKGGIDKYREMGDTTKEYLRMHVNELIVTGQSLMKFKWLQNRISFAQCMDQRMLLFKEFVSYFNDVIIYILSSNDIAISGKDCDVIAVYLIGAIEQALANTFLDRDLDHEQIHYPSEEIPDSIREQITASKELEEARVNTIVRGFALKNLPVLLAENIEKYKFEKYQKLLEKLVANVKETGQCIRNNNRNLVDYRNKVYTYTQRTYENIPDQSPDNFSDRFFEYIPLEKLLHQIITYDKTDPARKCTFTGFLRTTLIHYFTGAPSASNAILKFDNMGNVQQIQIEKHNIYIKNHHAPLLVATLRKALKMEDHEETVKEAFERAKKYKNKQGAHKWVSKESDEQLIKQYVDHVSKALTGFEINHLMEQWMRSVQASPHSEPDNDETYLDDKSLRAF